MRHSSTLLVALAAWFCLNCAASADAPGRVVSLNLCTDQLAWQLAAPGQLVSVSRLAADPRSSAYAAEMGQVPSNNGSAEAVVLLEPDLVLAGTFTTRATVQMIERLGIPVALFAPVNSLAEARANMERMGALLGREAQAAEMINAFDAALAEVGPPPNKRPRVALYYPLNGTAGRETLPGDILAVAGLDNIAEARGLPFGGRLPLEELVLEAPDMILVGAPYNGHARATEALSHPALRKAAHLHQIEDGADWSCETPRLAQAVRDMAALRRAWEAGQ